MSSPARSETIDMDLLTSDANNNNSSSSSPSPPPTTTTNLTHQSSIYSLTLDELQNAVCEPGKTFGSMNMDEFLTNIWSVEESQQTHQSNAPDDDNGPIIDEPLSLPPPLSGKTVDEVWAEIHHPSDGPNYNHHHQHRRELTFGEMTLEDFLIRAGVVRGGYNCNNTDNAAARQYGFPEFNFGGNCYQQGESSRSNGGGGGGGYCFGPTSPVESDGLGGGQVENCAVGMVGGQLGVEVVAGLGGGGRKRGGGGGVVERRQRRMIKNRESAARSRARKQAYTVELEAELSMLKEENRRLKQIQAEMMKRRRQMLLAALEKGEEEQQAGKKQKRNGGKQLRRCNSGPL